MSILHVMIGTPGSGKSTFVNKHMGLCDKHVSRDDIRFAYLKEGEDYFAHEDEVFKEYVATIKYYLNCEYNVWADATHLNAKSRWKLFYGLGLEFLKGHKIVGHVMNTSLEECINRNNNRQGTNRFVPISALKRMNYQLDTPDSDEPFDEVRIEV